MLRWQSVEPICATWRIDLVFAADKSFARTTFEARSSASCIIGTCTDAIEQAAVLDPTVFGARLFFQSWHQPTYQRQQEMQRSGSASDFSVQEIKFDDVLSEKDESISIIDDMVHAEPVAALTSQGERSHTASKTSLKSVASRFSKKTLSPTAVASMSNAIPSSQLAWETDHVKVKPVPSAAEIDAAIELSRSPTARVSKRQGTSSLRASSSLPESLQLMLILDNL